MLTIAVPLVLGLVGVYLLLPRVNRFSPFLGAAAAGLALLSSGFLLVRFGAATPAAVLFYAFSALAILFGGLLITQRNPVHAALSFALVVLSTCGLFLLQAAPFLMAATIIVYAGAIVVTFLFVIMLAQQSGFADADFRSREPFLSCVAGFVLLGALLYLLQMNYDTRALDALIQRAEAAAGEESTAGVGRALGDDKEFLATFQRELEKTRGSPDRSTLVNELPNIRASWEEWKQAKNVNAMRSALVMLASQGAKVRDAAGSLQPHEPTRKYMSEFSTPRDNLTGSENVAPLGLALFTDYLIPVELAGTLLLVATIGAIAIAGRRSEVLR